MCVCACTLSHSVMFDYVTPWTVAARLLCPRNFTGKNTRVGCHFLLQESSQPRKSTSVSGIGGRIPYHERRLGSLGIRGTNDIWYFQSQTVSLSAHNCNTYNTERLCQIYTLPRFICTHMYIVLRLCRKHLYIFKENAQMCMCAWDREKERFWKSNTQSSLCG